MARPSFRTRLLSFQIMRGDPPDRDFIADLEYLENRDLDLSVRLGAMLAFNALLITIGTHPVSASPGAPLSLDAQSQPVMTVLSLLALLPIVISCFLLLRALLEGEEIESDGLEDCEPLRRRLLAAFVHSIDIQARNLTLAIRMTIYGGATTALMWAAILFDKIA